MVEGGGGRGGMCAPAVSTATVVDATTVARSASTTNLVRCGRELAADAMSDDTCPWHYAHGAPPRIDAVGELVSTATVIDAYQPGSGPPPRTWEDEVKDLDSRLCCCRSHECDSANAGWYQRNVEALMRDAWGWIGPPARVGSDGIVRDGHHRIVAAWRVGIPDVVILHSDWPPLWWKGG